MKLFKITFISIALSLLFFNCKSAYVHNDFVTKTSSHSKIAVLPFHIIITGIIPSDLSTEEVIQLQEEEGVLFQTSLINQLFRKDAQRKSKNMHVEILSKEATNAILKENGYTISEIVNTDPSKLAEILNVDAVVASSVQKQRYMSNLTSAGIEIGRGILRKFGVNLNNKTNDIYITSNIINTEDGSNLFSISKTIEVDWRSRSTANIVDDVNRKITRNFPYLK